MKIHDIAIYIPLQGSAGPPIGMEKFHGQVRSRRAPRTGKAA